MSDTHRGNAVLYCRVSTQEQRQKGYSLGGQLSELRKFCERESLKIVGEFEEAASGKYPPDALGKRPEFVAALEQAKRFSAHLVVWKLDRLSRDVELIARLARETSDGTPKKGKVRSIVCIDAPHASAFELHLRAAMAQEERRVLGERIKMGLARAKSEGKKLGRRETAKENKKAADQFAKEIARVLKELQGEGITSVRAQVEALNERGVKSFRGGRWNRSTLSDLRTRCRRLKAL